MLLYKLRRHAHNRFRNLMYVSSQVLTTRIKTGKTRSIPINSLNHILIETNKKKIIKIYFFLYI